MPIRVCAETGETVRWEVGAFATSDRMKMRFCLSEQAIAEIPQKARRLKEPCKPGDFGVDLYTARVTRGDGVGEEVYVIPDSELVETIRFAFSVSEKDLEASLPALARKIRELHGH